MLTRSTKMFRVAGNVIWNIASRLFENFISVIEGIGIILIYCFAAICIGIFHTALEIKMSWSLGQDVRRNPYKMKIIRSFNQFKKDKDETN